MVDNFACTCNRIRVSRAEPKAVFQISMNTTGGHLLYHLDLLRFNLAFSNSKTQVMATERTQENPGRKALPKVF